MVYPFIFVFFLNLISKEEASAGTNNIKVFTLQSGMKIHEKMEHDFFPNLSLSPQDQLNRLMSIISKIDLKNIDLLILPEGVLPGFVNQPLYRYENDKCWVSFLDLMQKLANQNNLNVIFGCNRYDDHYKCYNSMALLQPFDKLNFYDKKKLVPLGEYLPFEFLKDVAKRYGVFNFYEKGEDVIFKTTDWNIQPSICYEDCFPLFGFSNFSYNVDFSVNITNDGWFLPSDLPYKHYKCSVLRAIETGRVVIRACENGYSGYILPNGKSLVFKENDEPYVMDVRLDKVKTLYPSIREKWVALAFVFSLFPIVRKSISIISLKLAEKRMLV